MKRLAFLLIACAALIGPHAPASANHADTSEAQGAAVAAPASEDAPRTAPAEGEGAPAAAAAEKTSEGEPQPVDDYLRDDDYLKPEPRQ